MELFLSKLLLQFISPLPLFIWIVMVSGLLAFWRKKASVVLLFISIGFLCLSSAPVFSSYLVASLERQYLPVPVAKSPTADAIVMLGGTVGTADHPRLEVDLTGRADRVLHTARLYRAGKAPIVIATGGSIKSMSSKTPESLAICRLLQEWGVPADQILNEVESLNTYQNAVNTKKLLDERGMHSVLLVTSASHMPRAMPTFRTAGINTIPSPTDYTVTDLEEYSIFDFLPDAEALGATTKALKEYLGLLVYRWRGWIE